VRVDAFTYELPEGLIAQRPGEERELARLMHLPRGGQGEQREPREQHLRVSDLPELVAPGALVVVNDTRVIPARLFGTKPSGGRVEVFLVQRIGRRELDVDGSPVKAEVWRALGRSNKPIKDGLRVEVSPRGAPGGPAALIVHVLGRGGDGLLEVALVATSGRGVDEAIRACGRVPLPPYIKRDDDVEDAVRYQTVYARNDGAVAAPTAGLHLTEGLLSRMRQRGCEIAAVTLHVGPGTFLPVEVDDLDTHPMHAERCIVSQATADAIARARARGAPVVAVGTTTVRALETAADRRRPGHASAYDDDTRLLIQPGYPWGVVDALLTNFHLPRSTLLAMVCAFGGTERVLSAYECAVRERYGFYSSGDAMLLWRHGA
jgi:S-adenosylmethionine:tRNA ribosyltransferase-isomerase